MTRVKASDLVSGMGTGMGALDALIKEIASMGGDPSVLAFLMRPSFKGNLTKIAEVIANCHWRFPVSKIRELAEKEYREENYLEGDDFVGHARHRVWKNALWRLGVPYIAFSDEPFWNPEHAIPSIPEQLREWIDGKEITYPFLVDKWVVTDWVAKEGKLFVAGETMRADQIVSLIVSDQKYFDFES